MKKHDPLPEEETSVSDRPCPQQVGRGHAPEGPGAASTAAQVHLILGPVGAGKSTYALQLARDAGGVRLALDDWMVRLFRPDRPATGVVEWYAERAARSVQQIALVAREIVAAGTDAVLELGLLRRSEREAFYASLREAGVGLTVHVLDAPRDVRRERVLLRNQRRGVTFSMEVPLDVFELASDLWEPIDPDEQAAFDLHVVRP